MRFVETSVFTKRITGWLSSDEYRALQTRLTVRPCAGALIRGSGGLRKVRWGQRASGRRAGLRVIYYWDRVTRTLFMLYAYRKNEQAELTPQQLKLLREVVRKEFS